MNVQTKTEKIKIVNKNNFSFGRVTDEYTYDTLDTYLCKSVLLLYAQFIV